MKKSIAIFMLAIVAVSCSDDETPPVLNDEPFFNLAVGNEWVYKKYNVPENGTENYMGIDTVTVTGQEIINGEAYFKLEHSDDENTNISNVSINTRQRVNEDGHLVGPDGYVIHPGYDNAYQYLKPINLADQQIGSLSFSSQALTNIICEGNNYDVIPFVGYFNPEISAPPGIGMVNSFQQGIGLVHYKCRFVDGPTYIEYRLVSYDLN